MNKRILILEPSQTLQKLIEKKLVEKGEWELSFADNGLKFLVELCNSKYDAMLINAKAQNPKSMELLRLIKSIDALKSIPSCLYATSDFIFENFYTKLCGADMFVQFDENALVQSVEELFKLADSKRPAKIVQNDILKNAMLLQIFKTIRNLESIKEILKKYLELITEYCELPIASVFILENEGPRAYYISSSNFTADEKKDFFKVSLSDFEKYIPNANVTKVKVVNLGSCDELDNFRTKEIPLSAYDSITLSYSDGEPFGSLHVVKEGNITMRQTDMLRFSSHFISLILENALMLEKKLFFEKRIRKAFSRFVPEQIIDELVEEADVSDKVAVGEKRKVAILFSDIRSFTSISECNKPEVMVAFLNRYFTIMVNVIKKHGGTIDKFIGDAIMALFGAPVSYEDNARRAVAAASEMREALKTVPLGDLVLPDGLKFNIGIGIHYGDVTVGSIGSADKTDYTVIGDSVNLASRLEGLTKTYGSLIVVSDSVKKDIKTDEFIFRYLDDVKVKGKAKSVPIYAIDKSMDDFTAAYRDSYSKGLELYKQGIWNLAKEYFLKALNESPEDKATKLMLSRCDEFIANPPENWDGAITFNTK